MQEGQSGAASGGQLTEKVDWSAEADEKIPQAAALAQSASLAEALALLAGVEKKCRLGNDNASLIRVCKASLELCYNAHDVDALVSTLETLSTRRSQKTAAVRALVETALPWCVVEPYEPIAVANDVEKTNRDRLVHCLRDITDGKIALEKERAQLTRALSKIKVRRIMCIIDCVLHKTNQPTNQPTNQQQTHNVTHHNLLLDYRNKKATWWGLPIPFKR